jgi:hypothetical protein
MTFANQMREVLRTWRDTTQAESFAHQIVSMACMMLDLLEREPVTHGEGSEPLKSKP